MSAAVRVRRLATAIAAGALAGCFLDPDNGRRRRHIARDRALALVRRPARDVAAEAQRKASYAAGTIRGTIHEATTSGDERDPARLNDPALTAKVESEIFRGAGTPKDAVSVNTEAGVVYLRGQLGSRDQIDELVEAAARVEGVGQVRNLLHLPDEEPPAKEDAPRVSL